MKATKLPSGNWRVQPSYTDANGVTHRKSFTHRDKNVAIDMGRKWQRRQQGENEDERKSFSEAMEEFLAEREAVLSPNTMREYRSKERLFKEYYPLFCGREIHSISGSDIQSIVTDLLKNKPTRHPKRHQNAAASPKTVRNYVGFISSVLRANNVRIPLVALPQKKKPIISVPDNNTVRKLLKDLKGTELEIPVMLAAFGPLRRGEICALKYPDDFDGNVIHVHHSMAKDTSGKWVIKPPKTTAGDRYIELNSFIIKAIKRQGYVTELNPAQITDKFDKFRDHNPEYDFRFHDLRHYCASTLHPVMSDEAIMKRGGWATDSTLKSVYRHTLQDQYKVQSKKALKHFETVIAHELHTKK